MKQIIIIIYINNSIFKHLDREMEHVFEAKYVSLHVRVSNRAALGLYKDKLKYE